MLFAVAFDSMLIDVALYQQLLVVVVLSMLATPPLAGLAYRLTTTRSTGVKDDRLPEEEETAAAILIIGFGRVGHRVGQILEMRGMSYIAVDIESSVVERERGAGRPVFYGDAMKPAVLESPDLIIVTVDDFQAAEQIVSSLHRAFPVLDILARGHDMERCKRLQAQAARLAVSENLEASIALARVAMIKFGGGDAEYDAVIEEFRKNYQLGAND